MASLTDNEGPRVRPFPRRPLDLITATMSRIAWHSAMKSERGVWCEKGAVTKKVVFSSTNIADRKRAFNL